MLFIKFADASSLSVKTVLEYRRLIRTILGVQWEAANFIFMFKRMGFTRIRWEMLIPAPHSPFAAIPCKRQTQG